MIIKPINMISEQSYFIKTFVITEKTGASVVFSSKVLRVPKFQRDKENNKSTSQYYLFLLSVRAPQTQDVN